MPDSTETGLSGTAAQGRTTPLSAPAKKLPIIVVPGVMGTRLSEPVSRKLIWNPLGAPLGDSPGVFAAVTDRLADKTPLVPDLEHGYTVNERDKALRAAKVDGYCALITDFYGDLCLALAERLEPRLRAAGKNVVPRVYACGYDWRQSNAVSADYLWKTIAKAQKECGGEQPILVAHSMGGLISRFVCSSGADKSVRAVFLLGSPTLGAPRAYYYVREGMPIRSISLKLGHGKDRLMDNLMRLLVLGNATQRGSRDFIRRTQSIYELAPTRLYGRNVDPTWLVFDATRTGYPDRSVSPSPRPTGPQFSDCAVPQAQLYSDPYTGYGEDGAERDLVEPHVNLAAAFHSSLERGDTIYMHPCTYVFVSGGYDTVVGVNVPFGRVSSVQGRVRVDVGEVGLVDQPDGDGTVPARSAEAPRPTHPYRATIPVYGANHGEMSADPKVIDKILELIPPLA